MARQDELCATPTRPEPCSRRTSRPLSRWLLLDTFGVGSPNVVSTSNGTSLDSRQPRRAGLRLRFRRDAVRVARRRDLTGDSERMTFVVEDRLARRAAATSDVEVAGGELAIHDVDLMPARFPQPAWSSTGRQPDTRLTRPVGRSRAALPRPFGTFARLGHRLGDESPCGASSPGK